MNRPSELEICERITNAKRSPLSIEWLIFAYDPKLSKEIRSLIAEQIGLLASKGWHSIQSLIKIYGLQEELIFAAGLTNQREARDWLIQLLAEQKEMKTAVLHALAPWGASLDIKLIKDILSEPSQEIKLAALDILHFKAHKLNPNELLEITNEVINDFRDIVVIATIKILQRRDEIEITDAIAKMVKVDSENIANQALMALGSIGTKYSYEMLITLSNTLINPTLRSMAKKQLQHQYRFIELS